MPIGTLTVIVPARPFLVACAGIAAPELRSRGEIAPAAAVNSLESCVVFPWEMIGIVEIWAIGVVALAHWNVLGATQR